MLKIQDRVTIDVDYLHDLLRRLVRVNSVLPNEQALAELVAEEVRAFGLEPMVQDVAPGRPNILAAAQLGSSGRFVTFTGHLDTVGPVSGWQTDPLEPFEENGRLYGLGSFDMKSGLACALAAFKALYEARSFHADLGRIGFAATVDEEGFGSGATALLKTEFARTDLMLLGEPFFGDTPQNSVPIAVTGKVLYRLLVQGRATHGFTPERGVNAIDDAARIVAALDRLPLGTHPLIERGNYSTLKIEGGYTEYAVVVPDRCEIIITRLLVPGETRADAVTQMRELVDSLRLQSRVTIETPAPFYDPFVLDANLPAVEDFRSAYRDVLGQDPVLGGRVLIVDGNTYVNEGGIPTITFGPMGSGFHEAGEYVEMWSLEPVARIFAETAIRFMRRG